VGALTTIERILAGKSPATARKHTDRRPKSRATTRVSRSDNPLAMPEHIGSRRRSPTPAIARRGPSSTIPRFHNTEELVGFGAA
jgi:hypothetical protein